MTTSVTYQRKSATAYHDELEARVAIMALRGYVNGYRDADYSMRRYPDGIYVMVTRASTSATEWLTERSA